MAAPYCEVSRYRAHALQKGCTSGVLVCRRFPPSVAHWFIGNRKWLLPSGKVKPHNGNLFSTGGFAKSTAGNPFPRGGFAKSTAEPWCHLVPELVVVRSPYRFVVQPIVDHVLALESQHPNRTIAVVISHLVEPRWYNYFLHNQRWDLLAELLFLKGDRPNVTINVPWYLSE